MFDRRPRRNHSLAAAITLVLLGVAPSHAEEKTAWSYGFGAAVSTAYGYRIDEQPTGTSTTSFDPGLLLSATVTRTLSRHTALVFSGGYRGYEKALGLVGIPEQPPPTGELRAEYSSMGVGLRVEPRHGTGPYIQALPALFVSRWEESTVYGTWQSSTTHTDSFRSMLPGVELSAGFRARFWKALGTDFALRLTSTADPGVHDLGSFSSGKFRGLDELALVGGISWSP